MVSPADGVYFADPVHTSPRIAEDFTTQHCDTLVNSLTSMLGRPRIFVPTVQCELEYTTSLDITRPLSSYIGSGKPLAILILMLIEICHPSLRPDLIKCCRLL